MRKQRNYSRLFLHYVIRKESERRVVAASSACGHVLGVGIDLSEFAAVARRAGAERENTCASRSRIQVT